MIEAARWTFLIYGILMIIGGILGYVLPEKPSKISLIAGTLSGLLAIAVFFIARGSPIPGLAIGLVVAAGVGYMMFTRWQQTKKFMPSGMVVVLSAAAAILAVAGLATSG